MEVFPNSKTFPHNSQLEEEVLISFLTSNIRFIQSAAKYGKVPQSVAKCGKVRQNDAKCGKAGKKATKFSKVR